MCCEANKHFKTDFFPILSYLHVTGFHWHVTNDLFQLLTKLQNVSRSFFYHKYQLVSMTYKVNIKTGAYYYQQKYGKYQWTVSL